jgi:hypothetical protein
MSASLAEVLARFGPAYLACHGLSPAQAKAWRAIAACRTPALGGQQFACDACGATQWRWHSCRNRHCPRCQKQAADAWRSARMAELLDVPYAHVVFTLPHELNALARHHPRWVYETLFECSAATLTAFAANARWLGGQAAFTLVLHTWTQELRLHLHAHALVACGALGAEGRWLRPARSRRFLFPVHALARVFAGKFCAALEDAERSGKLARDPLRSLGERRERMRRLRTKAWVVYAKTPLAGPAAVLDYLARYTHRTAIGHERLLRLDDHGVHLRVRADAHGGRKLVRIDGAQFVGRFLQHVLPAGFKRIRHYGLLASAHKAQRLAQARAALAMPAPNPLARATAAAFMQRVARIDIERCQLCNRGRWLLVQHCAARRCPLHSIAEAARRTQSAALPQAP